MKILNLVFAMLLVTTPSTQAASWAAKKPRLVVVLVIDQFRADYLERFQSLFGKNGFNALIRDGAYYPYGEYDLLEAMTGPGHSTVLTGSYPYQSGIPLNEWYDQKTHTEGYCVEDASVQTIGAKAGETGVSPRNLIGTTVGDELKNIDQPSQVIAVALKDRAAILMGGHRADLAFWYEKDQKKWTTSTYYRKNGKLDPWIEKLNEKPSDCNPYDVCGADMTVAAVRAALEGTRLGRGPATDILAVSFSSHDTVGHKYGPNSENIKQATVAEDKAVADIRAAVAKVVPGGLKEVVFVLTGDHGVAPLPEYLIDNGIMAKRLDEKVLATEMDEALNKKFRAPKTGTWIAQVDDFNFFLDEDKVRDAKLDIHAMMAEIKTALERHEEFAHVFSRDDWEARRYPPGMFAEKVARTYFPGRSGHVVAIPRPFVINAGKKQATHLTSYVYDRTVPIVFSGFGIRNGVFGSRAGVVDIAPTLAFLLGVLPPALNEGKVLTDALVDHGDVIGRFTRKH